MKVELVTLGEKKSARHSEENGVKKYEQSNTICMYRNVVLKLFCALKNIFQSKKVGFAQ